MLWRRVLVWTRRLFYPLRVERLSAFFAYLRVMKKKNGRRTLAIAAVALVAAAVGLWWVFGVTRGYDGERAAWVMIPGGAADSQVVDSLRGSLGDRFGAKVASLLDGNAVRGAYRVEPGEPAWRVARKIGKGRQTPVRLTFNNLRTLDQLAGVIAGKMEFSPEEFLAAADSLCRARRLSAAALPALFIPDTYEAYWTDSPAKVVAMLDRYSNRFWNDNRLGKAETLGLSPSEVATLASIVEEESNSAEERPLIARLYLNRLKRGMPLQADPTVKFACGDFSARRVTAAMLGTPSPYNTYRVKGLPPGPIRIPSKQGIDAVLDAPDHDWIYMCAKADFSGRHAFASDFATHTRNAAAYRRALDQRGIK